MNTSDFLEAIMSDKAGLFAFSTNHRIPLSFPILGHCLAKNGKKMGFMACPITSAGLAFLLGMAGQGPWQQVMHHCRNITEATLCLYQLIWRKEQASGLASAAETIKIAVDAGLAGCSLRGSHRPTRKIHFDLSLAVRRISTAAESQNACDPDFVITARAENFCGQS
ncbi:isocitrate lyase/phosphoenolpyruvate mutase family protein [Klebsiella pneumoniae]|uniref:isocitrate lyase/phosphoenolpyruvate mutase family protein n=1 Tax=Klebsiella pneumoniae TaxID=573 RepID=UPI00294A07EF|nr:isocitrate lyase/phosphoenolpyruvate mutase family protein [Klebsiella pneumoniae]MDV5501094.1 isocitrate lyase/phosphoenolpyruvate mutase family protein [Klebsiella pneumoniae]